MNASLVLLTLALAIGIAGLIVLVNGSREIRESDRLRECDVVAGERGAREAQGGSAAADSSLSTDDVAQTRWLDEHFFI